MGSALVDSLRGIINQFSESKFLVKLSFQFFSHLTKALDKEHELKSLTDIVGLPPSALQGLALKADVALAKFEPAVETIADLGNFKYFKLARAIKTLAAEEGGGKKDRNFELNTTAIDPGKGHVQNSICTYFFFVRVPLTLIEYFFSFFQKFSKC